MAYTPPSGTAVDFQLSGTAYTPPDGTAVDFNSPGSTAAIKFTCSIVSEANHQVAFVGAALAVVFGADANHHVAFTTSGETPALISGDSRQLIAFTTSGEMDSYIKFFTATILNWQNLLKPDEYKQIIVDSMKFLVDAKRVWIYGFVIMPNHLHILWHLQEGFTKEKVPRDSLKFTTQNQI